MARYGRGRPAHPIIFNPLVIPVQIVDADTIASVEGYSVAAAIGDGETKSLVDAQVLVARPSGADIITSNEVTGTGAFYAELGDDDAPVLAEASSIVAQVSSADTRPAATETGPAPPATVSGADIAAGVDAAPRTVVLAGTDPITSAEGIPRITQADSDAISFVESEAIDTFGGNSKLGQDSGSFTSASIIVASVSSADSGSVVDASPYIGARDVEFITSMDADYGIGIPAVHDTVTSTEVGTVVAYTGDVDSSGYAESNPSIILLIATGLANDAVQVRDSGVTPIDLVDGDTVAADDAVGPFRMTGADTASAVDAASLVARRTDGDTIGHTEVEQSPDVNLPIGVDVLTSAEAGSAPYARLSDSDTVSVVDSEALDRGTPPARLFFVPAEPRVKTVPAAFRVLQIPVETRVLVVDGGFR